MIKVHQDGVLGKDLILNATNGDAYSIQSNNSKLHPHAGVAFILPPVEWVSPSILQICQIDLLMLTAIVLGGEISINVFY